MRASGTDSHPFVILSTQRTGSSWLTTLLDSHPEVAAYGEMFLTDGSRRPPFGARGVDRFAYFEGGRRPRRTFAYLDELFAAGEGARAVGFKLMYDQLMRHPEIVAYLVRRRVRVLHLTRTNLLDVVISRATMNARGVAHATRRDDVARLRVMLDERTLYRRLMLLEFQVSAHRWWLRLLGVPHLEMSYEEMLEGPAPLARVLSWLGLAADGSALRSEIVKLNVERHGELVANYDAVARLLANTRYAGFVQA